jgi:hypothetical protein
VRAAALALLVLLGCAAPAQADRVVRIHAPGPGPARLDHVTVTKIGPASAGRVLVLMPGYQGGRGDFELVGHDLVRRVPGLQVWAVERRSEPLEDTRTFAAALRGRVSVQQAFEFYVGWLANPAITDHFAPVDARSTPYAARWGLASTLADVRRVVLAARRAGKRVILGGHSLGASLTLAYASWDFGGRPGFRDLDGLVLIDGGLLGSFSTPTLAQTRRALAEIRTKGPFVDLLGLGLPWAAGVFAELGALGALKEPAAPSVAQSFPLLPTAFKPAVPATNRGLFGFAFDASTSPPALSLIQFRAGHLGPTGDWADGEVTPIRRAARLFAHEPGNATEWYFPRRLTIDVDAANGLSRNRQTRALHLRTWHRAQVDLPLYAFQTSLTHGRVLRGARRMIATSEVPRRRSVLVDGSRVQSHLDPLTAAPSRNRFLSTVVPFLRRVG